MTDTPLQSLPPGTVDPGEVAQYLGWGDRSLRYRIVPCATPRFRLVYLHGIESHGTWFLPAAHELAGHDCTTYLLDRRGCGLNRDEAPGDTPDARALIDDVHCFRQHLGDGAPTHLVALSWGGKLALAAALDRPDDWESVTLITPGLSTKVDLPLHQKVKVALSMLVGGAAGVPVPLTPEMFTTTPRYQAFIRDDPWRNTRITARFCVASRELDRRIARPDARLAVPLVVFLAQRDRIIDNEGVIAIARRLRPDAVIHLMPDAEHSLQFERTRELTTHLIASLEQGCVRC